MVLNEAWPRFTPAGCAAQENKANGASRWPCHKFNTQPDRLLALKVSANGPRRSSMILHPAVKQSHVTRCRSHSGSFLMSLMPKIFLFLRWPHTPEVLLFCTDRNIQEHDAIRLHVWGEKVLFCCCSSYQLSFERSSFVFPARSRSLKVCWWSCRDWVRPLAVPHLQWTHQKCKNVLQLSSIIAWVGVNQRCPPLMSLNDPCRTSVNTF